MYQDCTTLFHPMHLAKMLYEANDRVPAFSNPTFWRLCLPTWDKLSKRVGLKCLISSIFISHIQLFYVVLLIFTYVCHPQWIPQFDWLFSYFDMCAHIFGPSASSQQLTLASPMRTSTRQTSQVASKPSPIGMQHQHLQKAGVGKRKVGKCMNMFYIGNQWW